MKKTILSLALIAISVATYAQQSVALADAHWGFEVSEATTLVGQYNSVDRYAPAGWTCSNGYQSASTQYKPYIVTNGTNIYASEGTQAMHLEGTAMYNLPYVILPAIADVDNYDALTLVFKVRPGYWSDFGGGEGMWSKCGSSDCRTIKVGHLTEIPDREDFASSVTNVWDTTFNAAGIFDPSTANPFCEVRIPMAGFGQYVAIYCEATTNCYFCIDEVSVEGGEPTPTDPYTVKLANAVWNFNEGDPTAPSLSSENFPIPANCFDATGGSARTPSSAYLPYIKPGLLQDQTECFGYNGDKYALYFGTANNPTSRMPAFMMFPKISDAAYTNLEMQLYARQENATEQRLKIGYIADMSGIDQSTHKFTGTINHVATLTLTATYSLQTVELATVPTGAYVVLYADITEAAAEYFYIDNISIKQKSNSNPEPEPEPEPTPLTKEALQDSINWWVPSVAYAGTSARATFVLHFQNGDVAYGYEWDGSATNAMDAMDEIVAADADLSASKTSRGDYYATFTYGELTNTQSWGWGMSKNDVGSFAAHSALALADGDMIIFSYDDFSVPQLATLVDVVYVEEKEAPIANLSITYNLTGCVGGTDEDDQENPTEIEEDASDLYFYFNLEEGHTWDGVQISVMMGETELEDCMLTWNFDEGYLWDADGDEAMLNVWVSDAFTDNLTISITCPAEQAFPDAFAPATFENVTVGSNGVYYDPTLVAGSNAWLNGSFKFYTYYAEPYMPGAAPYYSDIVVSSNVDATKTADYNDPVSYLYAPAATPNGDNFAVWNQNYYGIQNVKLDQARTLTGMYVNNTSAVLNYLTDAYTTFPADGFFMLTVTGYNEGVQTGTVNCYLVDWRNTADKKTLTDWEWLELNTLGNVDELNFNVYSDDAGQWGLNIPAYFCFDNLGGAAPTATSVEKAATVKAEKVLRNGQVLIMRGERVINVAGQVVR